MQDTANSAADGEELASAGFSPPPRVRSDLGCPSRRAPGSLLGEIARNGILWRRRDQKDTLQEAVLNGRLRHILPISTETPPMTMNVSLPPQLEELVRKKVDSGRYTSASEVVREALRLLDAYESMRDSSLARLRADVEAGWKDIEEGRVSDFDPEGVSAWRVRRATSGEADPALGSRSRRSR